MNTSSNASSNTPDMLSSLSPLLRSLLTRYERFLPWILVAMIVWLAGKSITRMFWSAFGMYWALRASGIRLFW